MFLPITGTVSIRLGSETGPLAGVTAVGIQRQPTPAVQFGADQAHPERRPLWRSIGACRRWPTTQWQADVGAAPKAC
jgi:hypothetical protein